MAMRIDTMRIIAVLSGKGGVGKSTIACNLAVSLYLKGHSVGLLDADIHCPNLPQIFNIDPVPELIIDLDNNKLIPCVHRDIKVMSLAFTVPPKAPVLWKGTQKRTAIDQLIAITDWGDIDFLIIDCPAGTGEELMAALSALSSDDGAIVVTTPHSAATADCQRAIAALQEYQAKLIGVILNMAVLKVECPCCQNHVTVDFPYQAFIDEELIIGKIDYLDSIRKSNQITDFDQITDTVIKRLDELRGVKITEFYAGLKTKFFRKVSHVALNVVIGE